MLLALAIGLIALFDAGSASATVLCKGTGNPCTYSAYGKGTTISATSGTMLFGGDSETVCKESSLKGEVTNAGGNATPVSMNLNLSVGNCSGCAFSVLKNGTYKLTYTGGGNGVLSAEGLELTTSCNSHDCVYAGSATWAPEEELVMEGGEEAKLSVFYLLTLKEGPCSEEVGLLNAYYTLSTPKPLYVAEKAVYSLLCKTAGNPCAKGEAYGVGTEIKLTLSEGSSAIFEGASKIACTKATIEGKVTQSGSLTGVVLGNISTLSFKSCSIPINTLATGTFVIDYTGGGNGILTLQGFELQEFFCTMTGPTSIELTGGKPASAAANSPIPGFLCKEAKWKANFAVTPTPLYVTES